MSVAFLMIGVLFGYATGIAAAAGDTTALVIFAALSLASVVGFTVTAVDE